MNIKRILEATSIRLLLTPGHFSGYVVTWHNLDNVYSKVFTDAKSMDTFFRGMNAMLRVEEDEQR